MPSTTFVAWSMPSIVAYSRGTRLLNPADVVRPVRLRKVRRPGPYRSASHSTGMWYHVAMKRRRQETLVAIFARPVSAGIQWRDIEALFVELGAEVSPSGRVVGSQSSSLARSVSSTGLIPTRALIREPWPEIASGWSNME